jgi:hypothetical protein
VLLAAVGLLAPIAARAQSDNSLMVGAGLSEPTGIFNSYAGQGWAAVVAGEYRLGQHPVGLRVDLSYTRNSDTSGVGFHETTAIVTPMVGVVYHLQRARPQFYLLAGGGVLSRRFTSNDQEDPMIHDTKAAVQIGEGAIFRIGGWSIVLEARFITETGPQPMQFFPITLGVRFGDGTE